MSQAFSRFHAVMSMIAASMGPHSIGRAEAMSLVGGYQSRGKGLGKVTKARSGTTAQHKRAAIKAKNINRNRAAHR